jgi:hypothetical protein
MKLPIFTASVLLLFGTTASVYARQEKGHDEHSQGARPAQQQGKQQPQSRPTQQPPQGRPAGRQ